MKPRKELAIAMVIVLIFITIFVSNAFAETTTTKKIHVNIIPANLSSGYNTSQNSILIEPSFFNSATPIITTPSALQISIIQPVGWKTSNTDVNIFVSNNANAGNIVKVESKIGQNGNWQDITDTMLINISENCTVYVQATDDNGVIYTKSKYIQCFDRTLPTVKASISNYLIHVEANDDISGVAQIYINGYSYSNLLNNTLDVSIRDIDNYTKLDTISVQAKDNAGNMSTVFSLKNPYYDTSTDTPIPLPTQIAKPSSTPLTIETPTPLNVSITITRPYGWFKNNVDIPISIVNMSANSSANQIVKIEAKIEKNENWVDITDRKIISISENCTIYVQATDNNGNVYSKNAYIECFDREKPTIKANFNDYILHIEANNTISGVSAIFVNGKKYENLTNNTLDIGSSEISDCNSSENISIQAIDKAGNISDTLNIKNIFYEKLSNKLTTPAKTESPKLPAVKNTASAISSTATTNNNPKSQITSSQNTQIATGKTSTSNPNAPQGNGSTIEDVNSNGREFYTVQTKDGNVFYMIVDKQKTDGNVYFLTEIDQSNMNSLSKSNKNGVKQAIPTPAPSQIQQATVAPKPVPTATIAPLQTLVPTPVPTEVSSQTKQEKPKTNSNGLLIILLFMTVCGVSGYYYIKIYKPRKELENADDLEDFELEEEEINEDEEELENHAEKTKKPENNYIDADNIDDGEADEEDY